MANTAITELDELGAEKVSGVGSPANGTDWLILKSRDVRADPESPHTESAEADAQEEEMTKSEADEIENLLTKMNFCGEECSLCTPVFEGLSQKAKLKAKARAALPTGAFALPEKRGYPIHDENHARAALSMLHNASPADQKRIKAAVHRKYPDIGAKSTGVPAASVETPTEAGHLATGQSGLAGPMTSGKRADHQDPSFTEGGEPSYVIPEESKVRDNQPAPPPMDRPGEGVTVANKSEWSLEVEGWEEPVAAKQNWMTLDSATGSTTPGSPQWERFDAATLEQAARALAEAKRMVVTIRDRETQEGQAGDSHDFIDAMKLDCAADAICCALETVAALAFLEGAEGDQKAALKAIALLTEREAEKQTAGNGAKPSEEEIMTTVTKEELVGLIKEEAGASATEAVKTVLSEQAEQAKKDAKKEAKKLKKAKAKKQAKKDAKAAAKNANNGGDISAETMAGEVHGNHPAEDVNAVGGSVRGEFINKGKSKKLIKALNAHTELLEKVAQAPRRGGPVLDGQPRGAFPASEGRTTGTVTKAESDAKIETLQKELDTTTDPYLKMQVGEKLTLARLEQGHLAGQI